VTVTDEVRQYWQRETCGTAVAGSQPGTRAYFDEIERYRYTVEPYVRDFAEFPRWSGRRVLEIGVGAATDFVNFGRCGAKLSGVDLTPAAVEHAQQRLALEGLEADVRVANAERLPFGDDSFDLVYSFGVIHHAEHPERLVREARRVLVPAGEARVMLYGLRSWVAYRVMVGGILRALKHRRLPPTSLREAVASNMESPGTQAYTRREVQIMFNAAGFDDVNVEGLVTPYDRRAAGPLADIIRQDWNLAITAR
jgi:SAM-dependent methyltransferase